MTALMVEAARMINSVELSTHKLKGSSECCNQIPMFQSRPDEAGTMAVHSQQMSF